MNRRQMLKTSVALGLSPLVLSEEKVEAIEPRFDWNPQDEADSCFYTEYVGCTFKEDFLIDRKTIFIKCDFERGYYAAEGGIGSEMLSCTFSCREKKHTIPDMRLVFREDPPGIIQMERVCWEPL